ncbi:MAG TPA: hypothetical protein VGQ98_07110 [Gemmatimonadaceae bacterium]|nr:hypothetical protein [Gemmatimonadaceae bacterium]
MPGSSREETDSAPVQPLVEFAATQRADREQLPPIEVFLNDEVFPDEEDSHELPPVEHFLDPLPAVVSFAPDAEGALIDESAVAVDYTSAAESGRTATEVGWLVDDWQQYDWRAAATLGEGVESQASNDWAKTDWEVGTPAARNKLSAAQAIASALDQIAQRIREGELTVPPPGAVTDPGAIAATLAALLGVRR